MKVMIDTNIFISAALFPQGKVSAALGKALVPPYQPLTCDYVVDELHRKFREKFPDKMTELDAFLYSALQIIRVIPTPEDVAEDEDKIRDFKDRPILRAALSSSVDLFPRAMSQVPCLHEHLANAARVNTPLLAAFQISCPVACSGVIDF